VNIKLLIKSKNTVKYELMTTTTMHLVHLISSFEMRNKEWSYSKFSDKLKAKNTHLILITFC